MQLPARAEHDAELFASSRWPVGDREALLEARPADLVPSAEAVPQPFAYPNLAAGRRSCPAARYAADGSDAAWPRSAQLQPKGRGTDRRRLWLNELSAIARQATTPVCQPPLCGTSRTTGVPSPVPTEVARAQQSSRGARAGSPGPSPHATGAPVSDFQEALGAAARLPLVLPAHRGSRKTSTALPLIGEDPEAGHGYEGKTGCE